MRCWHLLEPGVRAPAPYHPKTRPMSNPILPLLWLLLVTSFGCRTTAARTHSVETAVPAGVLTYEVLGDAPFSLRVENKGDAPVEVFVREQVEGPDLVSLRLTQGGSHTIPLTLSTVYVVLRAGEGSSFLRLSATTTSVGGQPAPDPPRLIFRGQRAH